MKIGVTYKVKESAEDVFKTVIEKYGDIVEFTPVDMLNEQAQLTKLIREIAGTIELETAKQTNIEEHHPFVKDLTMQQLFTAHMYYESHSLVEVLPAKLVEFKAQLEESVSEYNRIAEELGLDLKLKSPEVLIEESMEKIVGKAKKENGK